MTIKKLAVLTYCITALYSQAVFAFTGPINPHPRLILSPSMVTELQARARANNSEWQRLKGHCDSSSSNLNSGYYGEQWAELLASFALCYLATNTTTYATKAIVYADALANDRNKIGDGLGGNLRVNDGNNGYSIRFHGVNLALGYDWLFDYLSTNFPAKLSTYKTRLNSWIIEYEPPHNGNPASTAGYLNNVTQHGGVSNYFMGYFLTKALTGYATYETAADTVAAAHIDGASTQYTTIRTTYDTKLKGGDFPEGWMYGEEAVGYLVKYLLATKTATNVDLFNNSPILLGSTVFDFPKDTISEHIHALIPSRTGVYQGHDWKTQYHGYLPAPKVSAGSMLPLAHAYKGETPGKRAQHYLNSLGAVGYRWEAFLFKDPVAPPEDYTANEPLSYRAAGTGTVFMRSSWTTDAVWASFSAGPGIAVDHQHADQGHFTLVRGSEPLLIDSGDYGYNGSPTTFHNTILIDTKGDFPFSLDGKSRPGQSMCLTCAQAVSINSFSDDGSTLYLRADVTAAYSSPWWRTTPDPGTNNPATSVKRNMVYLRPGYVVIYDSVALKKDTYQPQTTLHTLNAPSISTDTFSATTGSSKVLGKTLLPSGASYATVAESNSWNDQDGNRNNYGINVAGRIQVASPTVSGKLSHSFLQVLYATSSAGTMPTVTRLSSADGNTTSNMVGAYVQDAFTPTVVLFSSASNGADVSGSVTYTTPSAAARHVLVNMPPNTKYKITFPANKLLAQTYQIVADTNGKYTSSAQGVLLHFPERK